MILADITLFGQSEYTPLVAAIVACVVLSWLFCSYGYCILNIKWYRLLIYTPAGTTILVFSAISQYVFIGPKAQSYVIFALLLASIVSSAFCVMCCKMFSTRFGPHK